MRAEASMRGRCLKPLAAAAGKMREAGVGFKETVAKVKEFAEPLKFQRDLVHIALYSTLGVAALVGYEYLSGAARAHGINAPSALELVGMLPVASASGGDEGGKGGGDNSVPHEAYMHFHDIMEPGSNGEQR